MKARSANAKVQLSDKLLSYSIATVATVGASSAAQAVTLDATYFGGSLPSISLGAYQIDSDVANFTIGSASFSLEGSKFYTTSTSSFGGYWTTRGFSTPTSNGGSTFVTTFAGSTGTMFATFTTFSAQLALKAIGAQFPAFSGNNAYILSTFSGCTCYNFFSGGRSGVLNFTTDNGGTGYLNLAFTLGENYGEGPIAFSVTGGEFTPIPEPASIASGLGLVALGFAGIREHRRRRSSPTQPGKSQ